MLVPPRVKVALKRSNKLDLHTGFILLFLSFRLTLTSCILSAPEKLFWSVVPVAEQFVALRFASFVSVAALPERVYLQLHVLYGLELATSGVQRHQG